MRPAAVVAVTLVLFSSSPALAWDPFRERPAVERPAPTPSPDPAPFIAPPPGIYYVTDTYVADIVTTTGPLTTYSTTTIHESTGSWARVLETVGTGRPSTYDGSAFNGRGTLSDGRPLAGTYYENYVLSGASFVPVSVVFFQDDAELARLTAHTPAPTPSLVTPSRAPWPIPTPLATPSRSASCCAAAPRTPGVAPARPTPSLRPVLSLHRASAPLTRIEVLRGRGVTLWLRAFVDEREVPVRSWSVASGNAGDAESRSGPGTEPFRSSWTTLAPAGSAYELVFHLEIDVPSVGNRTVSGSVIVMVRSPALER